MTQFKESLSRSIWKRFSRNWPLKLDRQPEMPLNYISLTNGDKGDAAKLLNVPVFLFDDKISNLNQVKWKGIWGSDGARVVKSMSMSNYHGTIVVGTRNSGQWKRVIRYWLGQSGL